MERSSRALKELGGRRVSETTVVGRDSSADSPGKDSRPYLVISGDSHAGPSMEHQLRPYCPKKHLEAFDEEVRELRAAESASPEQNAASNMSPLQNMIMSSRKSVPTPESVKQARAMTKACKGQQDPHERVRDMDADGVSADVIFAGGDNGEILPFVGHFLDAGHSGGASDDLKAVGGHIWNAWLADFISDEPERHVGVMQIPIWDIAAAVKEIEWAHEAGLRAVNLPAPRANLTPYTEPEYDPLWATCAALRVPILTHCGGGDPPLGVTGSMGRMMNRIELQWLSRRGLWQLIFGGVFERHPDLKFVLTEQGALWVPPTLLELDSAYLSQYHGETRAKLPNLPSEYWSRNCYLSGSFMAPFEAAIRHEIGLKNLMWGTDYPHAEGTWPRTRLAMRHCFADVPEADVRLMIGENALDVYDFDEAALRPIADRIGPVPDDLSNPLEESEFPEHRVAAFRVFGPYS